MIDHASSMPLEQAMRTIGTGLDRLRIVRLAQFTIDSRGILVDALKPPIHTLHTWAALHIAADDQRHARQTTAGPAPDADLLAFTRWAVLLRLTGVLLDASRVPSSMVEVQVATKEAPTVYDVQLYVGGDVRSLNEDLQQLLLRRRAQYARRGDAPSPPAGEPSQRRRWWQRS